MTTTNFQHRRPSKRRSAGAFFLLSLALHGVAAVFLLPRLIPDPPAVSEDSDETFEVAVVTEDEEEIAEEPLVPRPPEIARVEPPPPPPKIENHLKRKAVEQATNEERPDEAKFVSDEDNRVEEETRARDTSPTAEKDTREPEKAAEQESPKVDEVEAAEELVRRREDAPPEQVAESTEEVPISEDGLREPQPRFDPRRAFNPTFQDYDRALGNASRDQVARERRDARDGRRRILQDFEARDAALRASVENFITEVKPGNHTGVNAHKNIYASYIARMHRKIHLRWANSYLMFLDTQKPLGDPLNDPRLATRLEFVINASDGKVESVNIVKTSGELTFDAEAISLSYAVGPHPKPPPEIVSPNGRVYIHWSFHRDQRQCGPFHTSVFIVNADKG